MKINKTKVVSFLLAVCLIVALAPLSVFAETIPVTSWADNASESYSAGSGTGSDPYQISTAEELAYLAVQSNTPGSGIQNNTYYKLTADINLSAHRWIPIGNSGWNVSGKNGSFSGHFDGNSKTISGMVVDESATNCYAGLFGSVIGSFDGSSDAPIVQNLTIKNAYVKTSAEKDTRESSAGILIGHATANNIDQMVIENVTVSGTIEVIHGGNMPVISGGLAGRYEQGTVKNCNVSDVTITHANGTGNYASNIGGMFGVLDKSKVSDSSVTNANLTGAYVIGGFVGEAIEVDIERSFANSDINAYDWNSGGFVGILHSYSSNKSTVNNCAAKGTLTSHVNGWNAKAGGFAGTLSNADVANSHTAVQVTSDVEDVGGYLGFNDGSVTISNSLYDMTVNTGNNALANGDALIGVTGASTTDVLSAICEDYHGSHDYSSDFTVDTPATCTTAGSKSKHCLRCDSTSEVTVIPPTGHTLTYNPKIDPTSATDGMIEHWSCSVCSKKFSDAAGTIEVTDLVIDALGYTVTFDSTGGSTVPNQNVDAGGKATSPAEPTKEGATFDGWYNGANKFDFNTPVNANIDLIAKWIYTVQQGGSQTTTIGKGDEITFKVNGNFTDFTGLYLSGNLVDPSNYEAKAGSVIITLNADYVEKLPVGKQVFTVAFADGEATVNIQVNEATVTPPPTDSGDKDSPQTSTPQTGDNSNIWFYALLAVISLGAIGTVVYNKKRIIK